MKISCASSAAGRTTLRGSHGTSPSSVLSSKGEARRLIQQGGITLNDVRVTDEYYVLNEIDFLQGIALIKKGKKKHYQLLYGNHSSSEV